MRAWHSIHTRSTVVLATMLRRCWGSRGRGISVAKYSREVEGGLRSEVRDSECEAWEVPLPDAKEEAGLEERACASGEMGSSGKRESMMACGGQNHGVVEVSMRGSKWLTQTAQRICHGQRGWGWVGQVNLGGEVRGGDLHRHIGGSDVCGQEG